MKGNIFTEEIDKIITLSANDDKRVQWIDLIETYAYGTNLVSEEKRKDLVSKKRRNGRCYKRKHKKAYKKSRKLIIAGSGSGKANSLFNLISHQRDIDKIYFYGKDPYESKYQFLINKQQSTWLKHLSDSSFYWILRLLLNTRLIWIITIKYWWMQST